MPILVHINLQIVISKLAAFQHARVEFFSLVLLIVPLLGVLALWKEESKGQDCFLDEIIWEKVVPAEEA
jgi:hypothetical protein